MIKILSAIVFLSIAATAHADSVLLGNAANGKKLVQAHCTACHGSEVYTRAGHTVHDSSALAKRVHFCSSRTGANLNDNQINDVVKYLNDTFYHFEK